MRQCASCDPCHRLWIEAPCFLLFCPQSLWRHRATQQGLEVASVAAIPIVPACWKLLPIEHRCGLRSRNRVRGSQGAAASPGWPGSPA
jgi:hypothetical protein